MEYRYWYSCMWYNFHTQIKRHQGQDMFRQDYLKRILSIRIRVHLTWSLSIILITVILVTQYPGYYPLWERILLGFTGGLLFLALIIIVGLLTNLAAILSHIRVRNAMLFIFGEVIIVPEDDLRPEHEVILALITLLLTLVVAVLFNGLYLVQSHISNSPFILILQWLAFFWYILTLLHIIPVFPLAVGRLLVAGIWKWKGRYLRLVRLSAITGIILGICLAMGGLALILRSGGHSANGWLLIFLGWSLQSAATFSLRRATLLETLKDITATNVMTRDLQLIRPDLKLSDVVRDYILVTGQDYFAVTETGQLLGTLTIRDVKRVAKKRWESTPVYKVMKASKDIMTVSGEESVSQIVEQLDQLKVDRVPVLEEGNITGMVTRDGIKRLVKTRTRIKI